MLPSVHACSNWVNILNLALVQDIVNAGLISDAQLETVVYANMRFRTEIAPGEPQYGAE